MLPEESITMASSSAIGAACDGADRTMNPSAGKAATQFIEHISSLKRERIFARAPCRAICVPGYFSCRINHLVGIDGYLLAICKESRRDDRDNFDGAREYRGGRNHRRSIGRDLSPCFWSTRIGVLSDVSRARNLRLSLPLCRVRAGPLQHFRICLADQRTWRASRPPGPSAASFLGRTRDPAEKGGRGLRI